MKAKKFTSRTKQEDVVVDRLATKFVASVQQKLSKYSLTENVEETSEADIERLLEELLSTALPPSTRRFIESLQSGYEAFGALTDKQLSCLQRNHQHFVGE